MAELAGLAAAALRRFDGGRNCRIHGSRVVHAVHRESWLGGEIEIPAPACRIGVAGFDLTALTPTTDPVTCVRCHRSGQVTPGVLTHHQLTLWHAGGDGEG